MVRRKEMYLRKALIYGMMLLSSLCLKGQESETVDYSAEAILTAGTGDFAPFYMASNSFGKISSSRNALVGAGLWKSMNEDKRFSYGFGLAIYAGQSSGVVYERYSRESDSWYGHKSGLSHWWLQELYGEVKWRSLYLTVGQKEEGSRLVDNDLSSGDLTRSVNSRPIPGFSAGFIDFQTIPLTKGWLQIECEIGYGKLTDDHWWENHADYYNSRIATGVWYTYRRLYFRTKPDERFWATFGVQSAALFGGSTDYYYKGELVKTDRRGTKFVDFFKILIPSDPGETEDFAMGNTLGSYDLRLNYRMKSGGVLSAYVESPWEDGSGLAKMNGLDGLYGIEFSGSDERGILRKILVEYLDLTNQSGPIHWAPGDHPGTGMTGQATGADDYYNNAYYNAYANYGMGIGNSMVMPPLYNTDGYMAFTGNRMRGVNLAAEGAVSAEIRWLVKAGWRKAYGNGYAALLPPQESWSMVARCGWSPRSVSGLSINASLGFDRGTMPGDSFGVGIGLKYEGRFSY